MSASIIFDGQPVLYEAEANAGINLSDSSLWWGTLIKWRYGISGKWHRVNAIDVHPCDTATVESALLAYLVGRRG